MILGIDQGTTGTHVPGLRRASGRSGGPRVLRVRAALPAAGLGRARRGRDLGGARGASPTRRSRTPGIDGRGPRRRSGSRTSARPPSPGIARSGEPLHRAHRLAGPAHGRALRRAASAQGREPLVRERTGPRARRLLLGHEVRVAAAQRGRRRTRAPRFGTIDSWLVFKLDRPPRHRLLERRRARCCSTSAGGAGTRSCASCSA